MPYKATEKRESMSKFVKSSHDQFGNRSIEFSSMLNIEMGFIQYSFMQMRMYTTIIFGIIFEQTVESLDTLSVCLDISSYSPSTLRSSSESH